MMRDLRGKKYWLVGASDGLGAALAQQMAAAGVDLVLSARRADALETIAAPLGALAVAMDVTDPDSVLRAGQHVGTVDGVVYLAAAYWPMRAQDWNGAHVLAMLDANLTGAVRVLDQVLPAMLARKTGHVVLTGSLAGFRGLSGAVGYGASKAGLMHLAETLHMDLRGSGVDVQLVNPGFIRTRLTDKNDFSMPQIMEPDDAAARMLAHMRGRGFALSYPSPFAWAFRLAQFLPASLYYRLFATGPRD
jgi:NADP-dependent 3-hydroxy acid dehydrogenase YdfG